MDNTQTAGGGQAMAAASEPAAPSVQERQRAGWAGVLEIAVILGLALWAWVLTGRFLQDDLMVAYGIDPATVPRAIILVIVGLAALLLVGEAARPKGRPRLSIHPRIGAVLFALAALSLYAYSFETLGAFTLMPFFCVAVSLAFERKPIWLLLAYGVGVSILTWVVFVLLLRAPLPGLRLPVL